MTIYDDVHAIIQAGGRGNRLRPYTYVLPKPMLPLGGVPLICSIIDRVAETGLNKCYVSIGYLGRVIENALGAEYNGCHIEYIREAAPEGTIGSVRRLPAAKHVLSINGDLILKDSLAPLLEAHVRDAPDITVASKLHRVAIPYGVITRGPGALITGISEKPTINAEVCAGVSVLSARAVSLIPAEGLFDMPALLNMAIATGLTLAVYPLQDACLEVGTVETYHELAREDCI